jgi:hypothetical protein
MKLGKPIEAKVIITYARVNNIDLPPAKHVMTPPIIMKAATMILTTLNATE